MKKQIVYLLTLSFICLGICFSFPVMAQGSGDPPPPPEEHGQQSNQPPGGGAPVDGGTLLLTTLGALYGAQKIWKNKLKINTL